MIEQTMKNTKKVFRSRISLLIIGVPLVILLLVAIFPFYYSSYKGLYGIGGIMLFFIFLICGIRYIILGNKLYVKVFWIISSGSVNIADVISVVRSYNALSSPAASEERLCISVKKGLKKYPHLLISPVREREFIEQLKAINPDIYVNVPNKKKVWDF